MAITIDGEEFQEFLAELHGRTIINHGKELIFILRPQIDLIHLIHHFWAELRDLRDMLRDVIVDRCVC